MSTHDQWDHKQVLRDPEMLARLERNLRGAGMPRRRFLTMASAVAGTAALAACGGSSNPTPTAAPTVAPTTAGAAPTAAAAGSAVAATRPAGSAAAAPTTAAAAPTTAAAGATQPAGSAAAAPAGPDSTKVFIDYLTDEPTDNDFNRDLYCNGVVQHMSGLLSYDVDFNLLPDLAESYSVANGLTTFKIRKGAVWSDGQPIKAQDFVYSWRRMTDPRTKNGYGQFWSGVITGAQEFHTAKTDDPNLAKLAEGMGVRAVDDSTFEVKNGPFGGLIPAQAAYAAAVVAREDIVKKFSDAAGVSSWTDPGKTGGPVLASGTHQLTAWKHQQQLDLVRNDKYWNAKAIRQKYVTVKIIPNITKSTLSFENGDVDYQIIPATEVDRYKNDAKLKAQTFQYVYPGTRFLVPDTGHPPFDKLEVRKAVILAVDKDRLVNQVGKKVHTVAYAMTAPGVFGFFDDDDNKLKNLQKYDKAAAMDALKGTTFEGGRNWPKITLSYNSGDSDIPQGYPDEIARQLKENLNMDVQIEPLDKATWDARRFKLDLQFLLYRWYQDYPDPHNEYYLVWSIHDPGSARQSYNDPTFDDLAKKGAAEPDPTKRLAIYHDAETRLQTQFAYMPIHWRTDNYAIKPYATNFPKNKQGYVAPNTNIFTRAWDKIFVTNDSPHDPPK